MSTAIFVAQAGLIFIFSICNDWLAVLWHEAREKGRPLKGAVLGVALGLIGWLSLIWVVNDSVWLMLPDLVGTFIGSYYGIKHYHTPLPLAIALGLSKKPVPSKGCKRWKTPLVKE